MVTTELRTDPITGRVVVVDDGEFRRRDDFDLGPVRLDDPPAACPFCEGREALAGPEILSWRDSGAANAPGWSVRVVANRHPVLRIEANMDARADGLWESRDGLGAHEVVIETPLHHQSLQALEVDRLWRVFWAWRTRLQDLKRDRRFVSAVVFKNVGRPAGARLDHAHSQVVALSVTPPVLADELRGAARYTERTTRCIFCDLIAQEVREDRRVICGDGSLLAIAPYASRVPFETWLLPRDHAPRFEDASDATLEDLARTFKTVMSRIDWALEHPAFNLVLHTAPLAGDADASYHWHLEILPRVTRYGGLEWASGVHRNPVSPEEACRVLRATLVP